MTQDIHSAAALKPKKTGPLRTLTIKGKAEVSPLDDYLDAVAGIREGLDQAKRGLGRRVDDVFDDLERAASLGN